jgi:hypothetical protein
MRALYDNIVMTAAIEKTSENLNYPVSNLQDSRQSRYYRSTSKIAQRIIFDVGDFLEASYVVIMGHNLTENATIYLQGGDKGWEDPSPNIALTVDDIIILNMSDNIFSRQNWALYIDDPTNPDDFIQIAYVFLGTYLQLPGMKPDQSLPYDTTSKNAVSQGGQAYGSHGYEFRSFQANFPFMTDAQRKNMKTLYAAVRNYIPFVLLIWADDLDFEPPMYAIMTDPPNWKRNDNVLFPWGCSLKFKEVF